MASTQTTQKKQTKKRTTKKDKRLEFSKNIILFLLVLLSFAMAATFLLPIFFEKSGEICMGVFQTMATLTGSALLAYFGKAGFENYNKYKNISDENEGVG